MRTRRTVGLILVGCVLTTLGLVACLVALLGPARGAIVAAVTAAVVFVVYRTIVAPWHRRWGATFSEVSAVMPGDEILRSEAPSTTRAVTIEATPHDVFPWLVQLGYGRGGWYSYDWIDNDGRSSAGSIDPSLQDLAVGDRIEMMPGFGPVVRAIEPDRHIVCGGEADSWCLLLEPTSDGGTRLISRWRQDWPKSLGTYVWIAIVDPGAFLMEQKMLRTIRDLAQGSGSTQVTDAGERRA
ncbi:MAG TPA: hypothetical protein VI341_00110 [Actinomycetota bacterium]